MISELEKAIITRYGTLTYNASALTSTAPIYADIGKNSGNYPFTVYSIVSGTLSGQSTCSDFHSFRVSLQCFHICENLGVLSAIADVILEGFRNPSLSGLDGTQIRIDPDNIVRTFIPEEKIWQFTLDFNVEIEKTRS